MRRTALSFRLFLGVIATLGMALAPSASADPATDLSLAANVDEDDPFAGQVVRFSVTVMNQGPLSSPNAQVSIALPAGFQFVSAEPSQGSYDSATGIWGFGTLNSGEGTNLVVRARTSAEGAQQAVAELTAQALLDPDSAPGNGAVNPPEDDRVAIDLDTGPGSDLSLTLTSDGAQRRVGEVARLTVTVVNGGPSASPSAAVRLLLPSGLALNFSQPSQGSYASDIGVWEIGPLASGAPATLVLNEAIVLPGLLEVMAELNAQGNPDPDSTPGDEELGQDDRGDLFIEATEALPVITPTMGLDGKINDRWLKVKGTLGGLPSVPGACSGKVTLRVDPGARPHPLKERTRVYRLHGRCKFEAKFWLGAKRMPKRFKVTASFPGNSVVGPAEASITCGLSAKKRRAHRSTRRSCA